VLYELTPWRHNPKFHHRIHNSPPTVPILSQLNPLHTSPEPISLRSILIPSSHLRLGLSSDLFPFRLSHQNPVHVSPLSHAYRTFCLIISVASNSVFFVRLQTYPYFSLQTERPMRYSVTTTNPHSAGRIHCISDVKSFS
jgi:hypothetical protein